jgi:hypothetical protein
MEISGPLAFPEKQFREHSVAPSRAGSSLGFRPGDRDRSTSTSRGVGNGVHPDAVAAALDLLGSDSDRIVEQQTVIKKKWEEVPLASAKLYG